MRTLLRRRLLPIALLVGGVLAAAPAANAATTAITLYGTVGPTHAISLTTKTGVRVKSVTAGRAYTIVVRDRSDIHNFHLRGSGVARTTSIDAITTVTWRVTFRAATYTYLCDAHPESMVGTFVARAPAA
ncbi:MAG: hypothetical protein JWM98_139 [Thermoleophilia bacterium]|nr:hypothetical protein [Thermoleophilia bacterium]